MPTTRSLWRSLLTVFQIAILVAFSVAGAGHSHAGEARHAHTTTSDVLHPGAHALEPVGDVADATARDDAAGPCGFCCCHPSIVRWDGFAASIDWKPQRKLAGAHAVAFDSVATETLPEPPRTFA